MPALAREMRLVGVACHRRELGKPTITTTRARGAEPLEAEDPVESLGAIAEGVGASAPELPLAQPEPVGQVADGRAALLQRSHDSLNGRVRRPAHAG